MENTYQYKMRGSLNSKKELIDLIDFTKLTNITMIEIGSYSGESASIFLETKKVSKIICIDPWKNNWDDEHAIASKKSDMSYIEKQFDKRMEKFDKDSYTKFKGTIDSFIKEFPNIKNVDLVYIDGIHSYEAVTHDILKSVYFIKPAFISGHDYCDKYNEVRKAVDDIFYVTKIFGKSWIVKTI